ncbi:ABC transporter ATP-binding protein [Anaerotruncus colihominis]|uniref:ABC transporter ATP-binding protein n=2 Tax=Oscillospiraceae TaxID=216572 RepID=A0A845RJ26_9FIRM|nr:MULTISPECIES: ABC transporter ATP-binding protein [Anaerotruncus]MCI8492265.1 ABC transporter ATP-binding protein [Anaerotruncus sp.]MCR2025339.1 ABC transporter ATP-binding protein [Anaerotruncus colihominis]NBI78761.1 ABC transporter ATP-binding protein [Anaerotruncus colihominis]NDO38069.1 ABC transporter ATP-binding protein [Anaerotruncus colihominis]
MMPLVQLTDLCKIYSAGESEVRALGGVSLSIEAGEFVAITGQSGSGKSTLMNMLGCLDAPDAGSYLLDGKNVADIPETILAGIRNRRIGFIFQSFNLIPSLTALENVELPLIYRRIPRRERLRLAQEALERVGIANRMRHYPAQLSGGQQQRAAIARAIAAKPPIILADEPTGNLDSAAGAQVMGILRALHGEGHTIILITHDESIASAAGRLIRIIDGRVVSDSRQ